MLKNVNQYLNVELGLDDIIYKFSGLRWLALEDEKNLSSTSREVVFGDHDSNRGFMLTIYGGKLTSYRSLAVQIGDEITNHFGEFKRSKTHLQEYWANESEVVKPTPELDERFSKYST